MGREGGPSLAEMGLKSEEGSSEEKFMRTLLESGVSEQATTYLINEVRKYPPDRGAQIIGELQKHQPETLNKDPEGILRRVVENLS